MIGTNIKKARKLLNLTQKDLGEISGISKNYIGELERNKKIPSIDVLKSLSKSLSVSVAQLIGEAALPDETVLIFQKLTIKKPDEMKRLASLLPLLSNDELRLISTIIETFKK